MSKNNKAVRGLLYGKINRAVIMHEGKIIEAIPYDQLVCEVRDAQHNSCTDHDPRHAGLEEVALAATKLRDAVENGLPTRRKWSALVKALSELENTESAQT